MVKFDLHKLLVSTLIVISMLLYNHLRSHVVKGVCGYCTGEMVVMWFIMESGEVMFNRLNRINPVKMMNRLIDSYAWLCTFCLAYLLFCSVVIVQ